MERCCKKGYAGHRLKETDAEERSFWRLGCKNRLTPADWENKPGSRRMKIFTNTSGTSD